MRLQYQGAGRWLPGVPAADHDEPDQDHAAALVASGLYAGGIAPQEPVAAPEMPEKTGELPGVVSDTSAGNIPTESAPGGAA